MLRTRVLVLLVGLGCLATAATTIAIANAASPRTTMRIVVSIAKKIESTAKTVGEAQADCQARGGTFVKTHDEMTGKTGYGCVVDKNCSWVPSSIEIPKLRIAYLRRSCIPTEPYVVLYNNVQ